MAVTYYALLTTIGAGKLANATALGTTLKITQLAVGDGGGNVPTPDASRTQLVNEVRRAPLNRLSVDPANSAQIIAEQVIPEDVGGWWIREMGLYDEAGALIAYANCAPSYKPQLAEGSGRTQTVRIVLIVSNAASVELKIDPSVVLATREYVDNSIVTALNRLDYKQSVRAATTASITLSGLQTVDGVALAADDRVLVKNQINAVDNGLYVVASSAWKRATDADENSEVTPGLTVTVESGTAQADSVWQLVTDGAIVLGATALAFQNITNGLAKLASPAFSGTPTAPNPTQGDLSNRLATTSYVRNLVAGQMVKSVAGGVDVTLTADDVGYGMLVFTGALTANINVIVPNVYRQWVVHNRTSGAFTLTLKTAIGTGVAVTQGRQRTLVCNTVDVYSPEQDFVNTALTGNPTAPTPVQFDNDGSVATTAFVQRSLGNMAGFVTYSASNVWLSANDLGKYVYCVTNGMLLTLPDATTIPAGSRIYIQAAIGVASISVNNVNGNLGGSNHRVTGSEFVTLLGDTSCEFVSSGTNWFATGGSGAGSPASNGYQKFPSGLILQWGTVVIPAYSVINQFSRTTFSFATTFPNAVLSIGGSIVTGLAPGAFVNMSIEDRSKTGATIVYSCGQALPAATVSYIAIGY
ncbi:phage tail protein [Pseudomonas nitroreducens]|uniref:phage tail protein n=1 Tax=Pseudomonas nitroreducens TaxID=46680 RepID=UPI001F5500D6|nr:phage tail protein [Pseudomonas nitroreducens]